jgi:DNA-binding winged helix-turn-helix (wHTH) protein
MAARSARSSLTSTAGCSCAPGNGVKLTPQAFDLLAILIERRPDAVSKEELYERLWPDTFVGPASLDALVAKIRAALDDGGRDSRFVRTVYGFGYAFDSEDTAEAAKAPMRARLVFIDERRTIHLHAGDNVIGRGDDAAVSIESSKVSRRHANIVVGPTDTTIEDMGSKNGTFVGGKKITSRRTLSDGDEISVGPARMVFRNQPAHESTMSDSAIGASASL